MSHNKQTSLVEGALSIGDVIRNVDEASKPLLSNNRSQGFYGTITRTKSAAEAQRMWNAASLQIGKAWKWSPEEVRALLDSKWGRFAADNVADGMSLQDAVMKYKSQASKEVAAYRKNPKAWDESSDTAQDRGLTLDEADLSVTDVIRNVEEANEKSNAVKMKAKGYEFIITFPKGKPAPLYAKTQKQAVSVIKDNGGKGRAVLIDAYLSESADESSSTSCTGLTLDS